jgi:glutaredoxin-like YruB-family protein
MKSVTVYSTQYCVYCKLAKEYFTKNNIAFQEFDVGTDLAKREEMVKKSGQMGVPVIDIDGEIIVGFNKPKVAGLLNIPE